ncbi:MAG: hypothetical protein ACRELD_13255 [Longimicrobiales bacterium]
MKRVGIGFVCGFIAVLVFHQGMLAVLNAVGMTEARPFPTTATEPFGVPQIWSAAFWGGVWGVVFAWVERYFPRGAGYWLAALAFGAFALTLVAMLVVRPLKGQPLAAGGATALMVGLLLNGAWGVGTALLLRAAARART